ncbi:MAG: hypothetical protein ACK5XG_05945 [Burkholderiales bacterium]
MEQVQHHSGSPPADDHTDGPAADVVVKEARRDRDARRVPADGLQVQDDRGLAVAAGRRRGSRVPPIADGDFRGFVNGVTTPRPAQPDNPERPGPRPARPATSRAKPR